MTVRKMAATFGSTALAQAIRETPSPPSYDAFRLEELSELVEEKRKRIKSHWQNLEVFPDIIQALANYKSSHVLTEVPPRDYVLARLRSSRNQQQWKRVMPLLVELEIADTEMI